MAIFLLINSIGYTVYAHFCNDELKQTSLIVDTVEPCCSDEETEMPSEDIADMSCCQEEGVLLVIKDQFVKSEFNLNSFTQVPFIVNNFLQINHLNLSTQFSQNELLLIKDPPNINTLDKSILLSVFRI